MTDTASPLRLNCLIETPRVSIKPTKDKDRFDILDDETGQVLGWVRQAADSPLELELFFGKGGFMALVISPENNLRYFALPGSSLAVGGVELELFGQPIIGNPVKPKAQPQAITPQTETSQATILGAGLATRFERISGHRTNYSKPGVPLFGSKSVIECIANGLAQHGFSRLIVNTYFKPESVKASLKRSQATEVLYIDEASPSGTAGGLRKMLMDPRYSGLLDESKPLLVVQGDAVTDADYSELMRAHVAHNALVTIGCQFVQEESVEQFGIIVTDQSGDDGQSGRITGFQEKPPRHLAKSRLANTGFYIFSPQAYPIIRDVYDRCLADARQKAHEKGEPEPGETFIDFANDIFPEVLKRTQAEPSVGAFWAQAIQGYWNDIGNPRQYVESVHDIYAGKLHWTLPEHQETYYREGIIYWEDAQRLTDEAGARLKGNVVVGLPYTENAL